MYLWRSDFCPRAVRFKMFLPLTSVKNKLCTLPPDSLSWRRVFPLISFPVLIHKQRIYNPIFKTRCWNWKEGKFSPSWTRLLGCTPTAVSHRGWAQASHQAIGIHRPKILFTPFPPPLSANPCLNRSENHIPSSPTPCKERTGGHIQGIPYFHYLAYTQRQQCQDSLVAWTRLKTSTCCASTQCILALMSTDMWVFFLFNENISPVQTTFAQLAWISLHLMPTYLN